MANVAERVQRHRNELRAAGLRPIQIWVPDTRKPGFKAKARRQSRLLQKDQQETEILDWIESAADLKDWK